MGAGNVKAAYVHWGTLPGGPFRLLVYMALRTKDGDRHPQFWAGREDLCFGLGRHIPEDRDAETRKTREAAFKALKDAMAVLTRRGAVRVVERARPGRRAVYELILEPRRGGEQDPERGTETVPHEPVDNPPSEPVDNPDMGHGNPPPNGARFSSPMGHGFPPPRGTVSVPRYTVTGHGFRPPKEEELQKNVGLSEGGEGEGFPASSPPVDNPGPAKNDHPSATGHRFDYRAACEYLLTIPGAVQNAAVGKATDELGETARREDVLTRAAHIAYAAQTGVPA